MVPISRNVGFAKLFHHDELAKVQTCTQFFSFVRAQRIMGSTTMKNGFRSLHPLRTLCYERGIRGRVGKIAHEQNRDNNIF